MSIFGLVLDGSIIETHAAMFDVFPALSWTTDISAVTPPPQVGWGATQAGGVWTFTAPPAAPAPTLTQQATALLATGCAIVSTATPALNATYACDAESRADILSEMVSILAVGAFTNGSASLAWPDVTGAQHTFTVAQFKALATSLGGFVGTLKPLAAGATGALPAQPVTIA
jgi:hypothetical protein